MTTFRLYKEKKGKERKDGSRLVACYGCDGTSHAISYFQVWFDVWGEAYDGKSNVKPVKHIGKCPHDNTCKNLGEF